MIFMNQPGSTSEIPLRYKNVVPLSPDVGGLGRRLGSVMPWKPLCGIIASQLKKGVSCHVT